MPKHGILIVEDNKMFAIDLKKKLIKLNYNVLAIADSGEGAIKKSKQYQPALVLMDIILKGKMDGIETAKYIYNKQNIPIIYITASKEDNTFQRAKISEPYGYIIKPFNEREIHINIEIALAQHRIKTQLIERDLSLKQSEKKFHTIFEKVLDGILIVDIETKKLIDCNNALSSMLGYTCEEIKKLSVKDIHPEKDLPLVIEQFEKQMNGEISLAKNIPIKRKDKSIFYADVNSQPAMLNKKKVLLGIFRDVTQQKKIEENIIKISKLESIGTLAGGIAHDFNNLLVAILGNLSFAKMDSSPSEKIYKSLIEIEKAALQAKNLANQLLTFSKGGEPVKKITSIKKLLKETSEFILRGSNIKLEFSIPDILWQLEVDETQTKTVISNIIINAEQAMPDGGIIIISAENIRIEKDNDQQLSAGRYIKISVKDRGKGIVKKNLSKIFDPYFTTKKNGSGLGLAICYSIIKKHNGIITVRSKPGNGTTFNIYLPASNHKTTIKERKKEKIIKGDGKILIMDDEALIRETAGRICSRLGYNAEFAENGNEAIKLYKKAMISSRPFEVVIMDLTIPGEKGGVSVITELKKIDPDIKAIVSSGYSDDPVMSDPQKYGFKDVIPKPYIVEEMSEILNKVLKNNV